MSEDRSLYPPSPEFVERAWIKSLDQYQALYKESIDDPEAFWGKVAEEFVWFEKPEKILEYNFDIRKGPIFTKWFAGGKTNITVNALDRHLATRGDQIALLWEGNEPGEDAKYTYRELYEEVCKFSNILKNFGVKKGDRVSIYMPMVPQLAIAMLACARIGAIHSIVFGGFSPDSLADRILDSACTFLVTTDGTFRGAKPVPVKTNADQAMKLAEDRGVTVKTCVVYQRVGAGRGIEVPMVEGRDHWWHDLMADAAPECAPEPMDAEDTLFILYTSGSTGKPKGALHTVGGYMVYTAYTHKLIFDYHDGDIYWCTADIGWVTGHSYIVYGPLQNGATTIMFEGVPTYPAPDRFWKVVDKYKVTQFYTAPTAIRAIAREGDKWPAGCDLSSLRLLGTVGEPINPEAWRWYHEVVGESRLPIVDTWWQTETGGALISPLPGATDLKPGSATLPLPGVELEIVDAEGGVLSGATEGNLCITDSWPGQMRTVYGDHQRFFDTYFSTYPGKYFTGDGCRRDTDGYYWITGRVDDVINVSGHRMGTAEVESALVLHDIVAEAAVVGFPHDIKGQGIYAYVTLVRGVEATEDLRKELVAHVRKEIGPIAAPDVIQWAPALPKTRSGKIMRRILRKIAENELGALGDTSTLADPSVVDDLVKNRAA